MGFVPRRRYLPFKLILYAQVFSTAPLYLDKNLALTSEEEGGFSHAWFLWCCKKEWFSDIKCYPQMNWKQCLFIHDILVKFSRKNIYEKLNQKCYLYRVMLRCYFFDLSSIIVVTNGNQLSLNDTIANLFVDWYHGSIKTAMNSSDAMTNDI